MHLRLQAPGERLKREVDGRRYGSGGKGNAKKMRRTPQRISRGLERKARVREANGLTEEKGRTRWTGRITLCAGGEIAGEKKRSALEKRFNNP